MYRTHLIADFETEAQATAALRELEEVVGTHNGEVQDSDSENLDEEAEPEPLRCPGCGRPLASKRRPSEQWLEADQWCTGCGGTAEPVGPPRNVWHAAHARR